MLRNSCCILHGLFPVTEIKTQKRSNPIYRRLVFLIDVTRTFDKLIYRTSRINNPHLHVLKIDELLRVCDHVGDGSSHRKASIAFAASKLLHSSQHHPEGWRLQKCKQLKKKEKKKMCLFIYDLNMFLNK